MLKLKEYVPTWYYDNIKKRCQIFESYQEYTNLLFSGLNEIKKHPVLKRWSKHTIYKDILPLETLYYNIDITFDQCDEMIFNVQLYEVDQEGDADFFLNVTTSTLEKAKELLQKTINDYIKDYILPTLDFAGCNYKISFQTIEDDHKVLDEVCGGDHELL